MGIDDDTAGAGQWRPVVLPPAPPASSEAVRRVLQRNGRRDPSRRSFELPSRFATLVVQYWRSFDALERWANSKDDPHAEVWRNYWRRVGKAARTGIWHETYLVRAGEYEAIYGNMPPYGLARASSLVPLQGSTARTRMRAAAQRPA